MIISKKIKNISLKENRVFIETDGPQFLIYFMTESIVRIRCSFDKNFAEESYILTKTAWDDRLDGIMKNERERINIFSCTLEEHDEYYQVSSTELNVRVYKENFGFCILNSQGQVLHEDLRGKAFLVDEHQRGFHYTKLDFDNDLFYGFGERTGALNKLRHTLVNSPKDAIGHDPEKNNPMYKHIPFYLRLNKNNQNISGYFYNNTYESLFNMGQEISGYWDRYSFFQTDSTDIDLFFMTGQNPSEILDRYTWLTGRPVMLPEKALGYLGSTMYYVELPKDCDDKIINFIDRAIKEDIPISNYQLSSGYTTGENNKRYVFYWNKERVKNPNDFIAQFHKRNVSVSPNIKPGILLTHPYYERFAQNKGFIQKADGSGDYQDKWWGGAGAFVDFTSQAGRDNWKNLMVESLLSKGVTSIWNDNCEYDSVTDKSALCDFDGQRAAVGRLKSVQPNLMAKVSYEALLEQDPNQRPFVINRSGFAGIQRYAQTWAGDNFTGWKALKYNIPTILGMSISGVPNNGCDVGGFYGGRPSAELFVRWVQNGIFQPRFSIHSSNTDNSVTEPWMYPEYLPLIRDAIKLRYQFMPYLYSLMRQAHLCGTPIVRPLFFDFPHDESIYEESFHFMFGPGLLICNVVEEGQESKEIYLPKHEGCWYDWYTKERHEAGTTITCKTPLDRFPIFIKSGAIIPLKNKEELKQKKNTCTRFIIAPQTDSRFTVYTDDGESNDYLKGQYLDTQVCMKHEGEKIFLDLLPEGESSFAPESYEIELISPARGVYCVTLNEQELEHFLWEEDLAKNDQGWCFLPGENIVRFKFNNTKKPQKIMISYEQFDLIGID